MKRPDSSGESNEKQMSDRDREKQIDADRRELLRIKQGLADASEISSEADKPIVLTKKSDKLKNFLYYNGIYIIIIIACGIVAGILINDIFFRTKPDVTILLLTSENGIDTRTDEIAGLFEKVTDDINGDGEVNVSVSSIPVGAGSAEIQMAMQTKLLGEVSAGKNLIVISDVEAEQASQTEEDYEDISSVYPLSSNVSNGYRYMLKGTAFEDEIGSEYVSDDLYLAIFKSASSYAQSEKKSSENYDSLKTVFKDVIKYIQK